MCSGVEHGKHPDHDGGISGRQDFANAGGPGERLHKMDAKRTSHGHEESTLASHQTLPKTADDLPKHELSSSRFPMKRSLRWRIVQRMCWRISLVLSCALGWPSWSNGDEDWTAT